MIPSISNVAFPTAEPPESSRPSAALAVAAALGAVAAWAVLARGRWRLVAAGPWQAPRLFAMAPLDTAGRRLPVWQSWEHFTRSRPMPPASSEPRQQLAYAYRQVLAFLDAAPWPERSQGVKARLQAYWEAVESRLGKKGPITSRERLLEIRHDFLTEFADHLRERSIRERYAKLDECLDKYWVALYQAPEPSKRLVLLTNRMEEELRSLGLLLNEMEWYGHLHQLPVGERLAELRGIYDRVRKIFTLNLLGASGNPAVRKSARQFAEECVQLGVLTKKGPTNRVPETYHFSYDFFRGLYPFWDAMRLRHVAPIEDFFNLTRALVRDDEAMRSHEAREAWELACGYLKKTAAVLPYQPDHARIAQFMRKLEPLAARRGLEWRKLPVSD